MGARASRLGALLGALAILTAGFWSFGRIATAADAPHQAHTSAGAAGHCKQNVTAAGTIKYSDWQFPTTMNGYQSTQAVRALVASAIFDSLYSVNDKGQYVPFMMTKYPSVKNGLISPDGKTVTVIIKPGLRWSNGKPLTAADEKFGWQVDMNKITGPTCLGSCDVIKTFDIVNKTTVKLTLKHPAPTDQVLNYNIWPSFGWYASNANGGYARGNVKAAATWLEDPKTNFENASYPTDGPYKIDDFIFDNKIVMSPNPYYADFACGAYIKQLIFQSYTLKAGMEAAAASHDTDMTQDYTPADLPALQQHADAYKIWNEPAFIVEHLELNVLDSTVKGHPNALRNVRVRQALNLAIDKIGLIKSALNIPTDAAAKALAAWSPWVVTRTYSQQYSDRAITGAWDPLANGGKGAFVQSGTPRAIADARKLLRKSGHPDGQGVIVDIESFTNNPVRLLQMDILQQNWNQLGVTTNVAASSFFELDPYGDLTHGNFGAADLAWLLTPDPDSFKFFFQSKYLGRQYDAFGTSFPAGNKLNVAGVRDKLLDKWFNGAYLSPSPKEKQQLYTAIQQRIAKQVYWIPLYYRPSLATTDSAFTGFKLNPTAADDTWNVFDWKPAVS